MHRLIAHALGYAFPDGLFDAGGVVVEAGRGRSSEEGWGQSAARAERQEARSE